MGQNYFREISVKLLFKPFYWSGLSANQITVLNFLTLGLGSVILFLMGWEVWGLLVSGLAAMVDYVDGTIARARGGNTKKGMYLDTSLDWLWFMLLIGAISYHHNILHLGYLVLVAVVFGNWVQNESKMNVKIPQLLRIHFILPLSILFNFVEIGMMAILFIQWFRTLILYKRSICGRIHKID